MLGCRVLFFSTLFNITNSLSLGQQDARAEENTNGLGTLGEKGLQGRRRLASVGREKGTSKGHIQPLSVSF